MWQNKAKELFRMKSDEGFALELQFWFARAVGNLEMLCGIVVLK